MVRNKRNTKRGRGNNRGPNAVRTSYSYGAPSNLKGSMGDVSSGVLHHQVAGLVDPWSKQARGSKVPDVDSSKSIAATIVGTATIPSDAAGRVAVQVAPNLSQVYRVGNVVGTEITSWDTAVSVGDYVGSYLPAFETVRVVSFGVRVYSSLAPTEQSGNFRLITLPEAPSNVAAFDWTGTLFEDMVTIPVSTKDAHWISKPIGNAAHNYLGTSNPNQPWDRLLIVGEGLPASNTAALTIEYILNIEAQVNIGSVTASLATPAANYDSNVLNARNKVITKHAGVIIDSKPSFGSRILSSAKDAIIEGAASMIPYIGPMLARFMGGSRRSSYPTIQDVD